MEKIIEKKERNYGIDLLRIISMIFIIAHHLVVFAMDDFPFVGTNPNTFALYFLSLTG